MSYRTKYICRIGFNDRSLTCELSEIFNLRGHGHVNSIHLGIFEDRAA